MQSTGKPADYDQAKDPAYKPLGATRLRPDGVWDCGGQNFFTSPRLVELKIAEHRL